ncbi:LysR substrate-binding domain-containing protein [Paracraurococcus ruber]|uniref:LysR substrate-binding domain-containing protein n=1 Tax=Paracraurococcus ruber TaxID=77675 RepID=UPI001961916A|nr:LysR substrate-binding domain-containing protein [Paracraurococcus ruber]
MDTLEAFDAAARLGSFTAAAAVLHRTPGAISRQMAALEGDLGVALFLREARGVALTPAGRRLHAAAAEALALLLGAARELRRHGPGGEGGGTVRISVNPSFGARWLLPRLPRFQAAHPRVAVVPVAETRLVDLAREGFDLAVRYTAGAAPPGLALHPWLREELVPVAAPALLEGRPRTPDALAALPFLHDTSDAFWRHWLAAAGRPELLPPSGTVFNDYNLAVGAAVSGLGVLVGRSALIAAELRDGRLAEAVPLRVPSPRAYHLARPAGGASPAAEALWAWLLAQGGTGA